MTDVGAVQDEEISLLTIGSTLLRRWQAIAKSVIAVGLLAVAYAVLIPPTFLASASFTVQSNDPNRSGLAALAGQMGIGMPTANQSSSPEFFSMLLRSRTLLEAVARDTLVVPEKGGRRIAVSDLFEVRGRTPAHKIEKTVKRLSDAVYSTVSKPTGVVRLEVTTRWRSASLAIAEALVDGVNVYNMNTRQGQATAERRFVQARLAVADTEVRQAEDRLKVFYSENRQSSSSPELAVDRDRLQRAVVLKQQVFTSLTQSYEDARLREVRETPAITIVEKPAVPTDPESRGRIMIVVIGGLLGALLGIMVGLVGESITRRRSQGELRQFIDAYVSAKSEVRGRIVALVSRVRR